MAITKHLDELETIFGFTLLDPYLFALLFWADDLSLPTTEEQRVLLSDVSTLQAWVTGRKILKTLSLERDLCWYGITHFGMETNRFDEALFVTPRESHLEPTRDRVFAKINNTPFFRQLVRDKNKSGGGQGILEWSSDFKWHFRIEGISGTDENMAGIRARVVLGDEMAFANISCWNSRVMSAYPDARVKYCGVPNGVRGTPFYELDTNPAKSAHWSKHNYPSFINPLYQTPEAQARLEREYGGRNTQAWLTQVLGQWGAEAFTSFPPGSIAVNSALAEFVRAYGETELVNMLDNLSAFRSSVVLPFVSADRHYAVGVDYGFSPDPTVITVAMTQDMRTWSVIARIDLVRVKLPTQAKFLHALCQWVLLGRVLKLSSDNTSLLQLLTERSLYGVTYEPLIHFADPGGATDVLGADGKPLLNEQGHIIRKRNKQHYTDELRLTFQMTLMNGPSRFYLWLPQDSFLLDALSSMTERKTEANYIVYEAAKAEQEHCIDALRYLLGAILSATAVDRSEDLSEVLSASGWVGPKKDWQAPWA